jgi:hypothetical protein
VQSYKLFFNLQAFFEKYFFSQKKGIKYITFNPPMQVFTHFFKERFTKAAAKVKRFFDSQCNPLN